MEKLDIKSLKSPEDIPAGTIMVQHWCNSSTFFKVIGTSKKSVLVVKMPSKRTHFDHEGGGTGYSYKMPDEETLKNVEAAYKACNKKYGFDVLKGSREQFDEAHKLAKANNENFWDDFTVVSNYRECLQPKRIMAKPAKDGGFYIPGYYKGSWCGPMQLWNGEEVSDYYD